MPSHPPSSSLADAAPCICSALLPNLASTSGRRNLSASSARCADLLESPRAVCTTAGGSGNSEGGGRQQQQQQHEPSRPRASSICTPGGCFRFFAAAVSTPVSPSQGHTSCSIKAKAKAQSGSRASVHRQMIRIHLSCVCRCLLGCRAGILFGLFHCFVDWEKSEPNKNKYHFVFLIFFLSSYLSMIKILMCAHSPTATRAPRVEKLIASICLNTFPLFTLIFPFLSVLLLSSLR